VVVVNTALASKMTTKPLEGASLPSRATFLTPQGSVVEATLNPLDAQSKNFKQTLSQSTIPEEGPEHSDDDSSELPVFAVPVFPPGSFSKPEARIIKTVQQDSTAVLVKATSLTKKFQVFQREPQESISVNEQPPDETLKLRSDSVEKLFFKAVRSSSKNDSKSKTKDTPTSGNLSDIQHPSATAKMVKESSSKKNAHEKRDLFKSSH